MQTDVTRQPPDAGFADPVMEAQAVFRAVMEAMAEPGTVRAIDPQCLARLHPPAPLGRATAGVLLALADFETPVWLDAGLSDARIAGYLRFHAGAPLVDDPAQAAFAVVAEGASLDDLAGFATGTLEYPDRSTTVIVQLAALTGGEPWILRGPGIATDRRLDLPVAPGLWAAIAANRRLFPCGVDLVFTDGDRIIGLPRSTRVCLPAETEG